MNDTIFVGTDGSPEATIAVGWAADDAARKKLRLELLYANEQTSFVPEPERMLSEAARAVQADHPSLEVGTRIVDGAAVAILCAAAERSAQVVVGSRGLGAIKGVLLGSVSQGVASHVRGTAVVVRPAVSPEGPVVVSVDDTGACEAAMAHAFEEARLRHVALRAIYSYHVPLHAISFDPERTQREEHNVLLDKLAVGRATHPDVTVIDDLTSIDAVTALSEASRTAALLVLGGSMAPGSMGRGVLHHAHCPMAVVRRP